VSTFHVVGSNFQLGFGIDPRFGRQQQVFAELAGIRELCRFWYEYLTVKDSMGTVIYDAFVNLLAGAMWFGVGDRAVSVGDLLSTNHRQSAQGRFGLLTRLINLQVMAGEGCP
jgi:hypothetical protein